MSGEKPAHIHDEGGYYPRCPACNHATTPDVWLIFTLYDPGFQNYVDLITAKDEWDQRWAFLEYDFEYWKEAQ